MHSSPLEQSAALTTGTLLGFVLALFLGSVASSSPASVSEPSPRAPLQLLDQEFESWDRELREREDLDREFATWGREGER